MSNYIKPYILLWPDADQYIYEGKVIGMIVSKPEVSPFDFLALTINREDLSLRDSIRFAKYANSLGTKVVFVPTLDSRREPWFLTSVQQHEILVEIAQHSQDDIQTAVLAGRGEIKSLVDYNYAAVAYSYNQILGSTVHHAEAVLAEFLKVISFKEPKDEPGLWWLMLLEPCEHCLRNMVDAKASLITYYNDHKAKWNTPEYLALKNELVCKRTYTKEIIVEEVLVPEALIEEVVE